MLVGSHLGPAKINNGRRVGPTPEPGATAVVVFVEPSGGSVLRSRFMPMDEQRRRRLGWHMIGVAAWLVALSIMLNAITGAPWWSWLMNGIGVGGVVCAVALRLAARRHWRIADELNRQRDAVARRAA